MFRYANEKAVVFILVAMGAVAAGISLFIKHPTDGIVWKSLDTWWGILGAGAQRQESSCWYSKNGLGVGRSFQA
jgi:hypothetical protein